MKATVVSDVKIKINFPQQILSIITQRDGSVVSFRGSLGPNDQVSWLKNFFVVN